MAIPSGSGTEVLKSFLSGSGTGWITCITGVANHIYTIISFTICDANGTELSTGFQVKFKDASANDYYIYQNVVVPTKGTFVHNDRLIMVGNVDFEIKTFENAHISVSYIDQDWT